MNRYCLIWVGLIALAGCQNSSPAYFAIQTSTGPRGVLNVTLSADPPDQNARSAAESWLALVDTGQAERAWDASGTFLQRLAPKQSAVPRLLTGRAKMGKLMVRQLSVQQHVQELPGAPAGNYVVLRYRTTFQARGISSETVTMSWEGDAWKVAGYFLK